MKNPTSPNSSVAGDIYSLLSKEELIIQLKALQKANPLKRGEKELQSESNTPAIKHIAGQDLLFRIDTLVRSNLNDPAFGNSRLANALGMSESQLYRKLKALTGRSTAIYIRSVRLQSAKNLLVKTTLTIAQVAYGCGFNSPSYFTHVYAKEFDILPSQTRNEEME
ncbi:helix-turn-helix transcriptional regulator [Lewinella cohaerens]|uniref:helix-turn-helix transcriptional regulator n=1 Tax=Lewinella cohaerens TaxID=70995 RepID=UPI00036500C0|nr:helix-turn-helix transcriptional regulator [Lewinella cohaerens]